MVGVASSNLVVRFKIKYYAPVAQLDRVPDYESGGCRFESCRVHVSKAKVDRLAYRLSGEIDMGSWH